MENFTSKPYNMNISLNMSDDLKSNATSNMYVGYMPDVTNFVVLTVSSFGFIGNILTIIILLKHEMKSFSVLLCCMFLSDLLFTVTFMVAAITHMIGYDTELTRELLRTAIEFCLGMSNGFACLAAVERSIAILRAIWYHRCWKRKYSVMAIGAVIAVNVAFEIIRRLDVGIDILVYLRILEHVIRRYIPFVLIITGNIMMAVGIIRSMKARKKMTSTAKKDMNITRPIFTLVLTYFICTAPGSIMILLLDLGLQNPFDMDTRTILMVTMVLECFNASVNFLVYALVNGQYRAAFIALICFRRKPEESKQTVVAVIAKGN